MHTHMYKHCTASVRCYNERWVYSGYYYSDSQYWKMFCVHHCSSSSECSKKPLGPVAFPFGPPNALTCDPALGRPATNRTAHCWSESVKTWMIGQKYQWSNTQRYYPTNCSYSRLAYMRTSIAYLTINKRETASLHLWQHVCAKWSL